MSTDILLDTDIVIGLLNNRTGYRDNLHNYFVHLSSIVVGELYFGAYHSQRVSKNLTKLEIFISQYPVLDCNLDTSEVYGRIKKQLLTKGRPLPENDIWLASQAIQYELKLVSNDQHFTHIDDLDWEKW